MKTVYIQSTCPSCAGKQFLPKGHITRKRNRRVCPVCQGQGEVRKLLTLPS